MDRVELQAPPRLEPAEGAGGVLAGAVPMLGGIGAVAVTSTVVAGSASGSGGRMYVAAGAVLLATVLMVVVQVDRQRTRHRDRVAARRTAYLRHLAHARGIVNASAERQRDELASAYPEPGLLPSVAEQGDSVWSARPGDPAYLTVRYGRGDRRLDLELVEPPPPDEEVDPVAARALDRFVRVHRSRPGLPLAVDLTSARHVVVAGPAEETSAWVRAFVCSAAFRHRPEHLAIDVAPDPDSMATWDWLKWLPHVRSGAAATYRLVLGAHAPSTGLTVVEERVADDLTVTVDGGPPLDGVLDRCGATVAEAFARRMAALTTTDPGPLTEPVARTAADRLRVPIGHDTSGGPVHLDLKESAQHGMGPHGLLVGATGSGKSELLRTLVLGLASTHGPDELNLVLVDFKGGATFAGLAPLPHVSALITNLAQELPLVDRMQDALTGELVRRQQLLRAAGDLASVHDYEAARCAGADLTPLPSLLVVVDEFSELLAAQPDFIDLFVAIGRLGRSLGVHLLLASQRLDEGRLRGLESHLSYRIALRTFGAQESRAVIGVPDAHELPAVPGLGFLRTDPTTLVGFTAAYVSGPSPLPTSVDDQVVPFTLTAEDVATPAVGSVSVMEETVRRLSGVGPAAHRIWLPPLDAPPHLEQIDRGAEPLVVPVGVVDLPREQRQDPLLLDLSGGAGHVAVVGGPRSGRSTMLSTIASSLARQSSPQDLQLFVLDLGAALEGLETLPHLAARATRTERELVRRVVGEVQDLVDGRESPERIADRYGEVVLVVDGWGVLRDEYADLEPAVQQIAARGLGVGVHVVAAAARWADLRASVRDLFGTRLELRLGDPADSEIDRRQAALVPLDRPGRGLTAEGRHFLAALPTTSSSWASADGPKLRTLPSLIPVDTVDAPRGRLRLGLEERGLRALGLDPVGEPHLLVIGDAGSGKTATLRLLAHEVVRTRTPAQAQLLVLDPRRNLVGAVPDRYLLDASVDAAAAHLGGRRSGWSGADLFVLVDDHDLVGPALHPLLPLLPVAADVGLHVVVARRSGGVGRALFDPVLQALRDLAAPTLLLSGSPDEGPVLGGVRLAPAAPGRGRLVTRDRGVEVVQVAWVEPYSASA